MTYKRKFKHQEKLITILFLVNPQNLFIYNSAERLLKQNYPIKNIIKILKEKYNV